MSSSAAIHTDPKSPFFSPAKYCLNLHRRNIGVAVHPDIIDNLNFFNQWVWKVNEINFNIINKTKNPKPGLLLFVEKSMPESCFKFINNFLVIKLFVGKKIKIDRTAMAISQRQSGSANK